MQLKPGLSKSNKNARRRRSNAKFLAISLCISTTGTAALAETPGQNSTSASASSGTSSQAQAEPDSAAKFNTAGIKAYKEGHKDEAEIWFKKSAQELWSQPDQIFALSIVLTNEYIVLNDEHKDSEAPQVLEQARKIREDLHEKDLVKAFADPKLSEIPPTVSSRNMMQQLFVGILQAAQEKGKGASINITVPPELKSSPPQVVTQAADQLTPDKCNEEGIKAFRAHKTSEAEKLYLKGIELCASAPEQWRTAVTLCNDLSILYESTGNKENSEKFQKQATTIASLHSGTTGDIKFSAAESTPPVAKSDSGSSKSFVPISKEQMQNWQVLLDKGKRFKDSGNYKEAEPVLLEALKLAEKFGPNNMMLALNCNFLAGVYLHTDRPAQAEALYLRTVPIIEAATGPNSIPLANTIDNICEALLAQKKYSDAEANYKRAIAIYAKFPGKGDRDLGLCLSNLAILETSLGRRADAELHYEKALELTRRTSGESANYGIILDGLAYLKIQDGDYARAEALSSRALPIIKKGCGPRHPEVASCMINLAGASVRLNKLPQAALLYKDALDIQSSAFGASSSQVKKTAANLAFVQRALHTGPNK